MNKIVPHIEKTKFRTIGRRDAMCPDADDPLGSNYRGWTIFGAGGHDPLEFVDGNQMMRVGDATVFHREYDGIYRFKLF
jgi:hypothetical protein